MKWHGISIYDGNDFQFTRMLIWDGTAWKYADPKIYLNRAWKTIGGACTNMLWLEDGNGDLIYQNGGPYLVREIWASKLFDENNAELIDSQDRMLIC